jgi:HlyD family secretion protein
MADPSPTTTLSWFRNKRSWLLISIAAAVGFVGLKTLAPKPKEQPAVAVARKVTALGRLTPEGGLVTLSVPAGTSGGNEVVKLWLVAEGEPIRKGQLLARLSSYGQLQSALRQSEASLTASQSLLPYLKISEAKGLELYKDGAISEEELGKATATLVSRQADIQGAQAALDRAQLQLEAGEIRAPLDGTLIRIYSWPGMKETSDGLAMIGRTERMEAWAQVFQSDVQKLQVGQGASIKAESGGFSGPLRARLKSIVGNVSERDLFATNGNNDVNARVVLVKLVIDPTDRRKVERLSGLNVTVIFDQ